MQKIILYILVVSTVLACKTNKNSTVLQYEDSTELSIEAAFIQKEIPGTEGEKAKTFLTVIFSELVGDHVKVEKLEFVGDYFLLQEIAFRDEKTLKIDVTNSDFWNKSTIPEVTIYYTIAGKKLKQEIKSIVKEPIYLP